MMSSLLAILLVSLLASLSHAQEVTSPHPIDEEQESYYDKALLAYGPLCDEGGAPKDFCSAVRRAQFEFILEQRNFVKVPAPVLRQQTASPQQKRDYDFVRFGRSSPLDMEKKASSYDYIRFGKRAPSGRLLRNFGRG